MTDEWLWAAMSHLHPKIRLSKILTCTVEVNTNTRKLHQYIATKRI